jgi:hypothetical protein
MTSLHVSLLHVCSLIVFKWSVYIRKTLLLSHLFEKEGILAEGGLIPGWGHEAEPEVRGDAHHRGEGGHRAVGEGEHVLRRLPVPGTWYLASHGFFFTILCYLGWENRIFLFWSDGLERPNFLFVERIFTYRIEWRKKAISRYSHFKLKNVEGAKQFIWIFF